MKLRLLALPLAIAALATALAQTPPASPPPNTTAPPNTSGNVNDVENKLHFWDAILPGGNFTISLGKICSVAVHEYNTTGGRVTEVNVDTDGSVCARFYYMEPLKAGGAFSGTQVIKDRLTDVAETVADRTGTDKVWKQVQKDYPIATHAHTVEFRLQDRSNLFAIHTSVKSAWMSGRGRTIKISEVQ